MCLTPEASPFELWRATHMRHAHTAVIQNRRNAPVVLYITLSSFLQKKEADQRDEAYQTQIAKLQVPIGDVDDAL